MRYTHLFVPDNVIRLNVSRSIAVEILAEWESVSKVFGTVRPAEKPDGQEETPPTGGESSTAA